MATDTLVGQDIIDLANARLSGYANAVSQDDLLGFINEGKDAVWNAIKSLEDEFFLTFSQATNANASYYFPALSTTVREYDLPMDVREVKFIECMTTGFTDVKFVYRNPTDEDFRAARRGANDSVTPAVNVDSMLYTIVGKKKFVLADYPPAALTLQIWYVRSLADIEADSAVDEVIFPYSKKIASYAAKAIMLATQDAAQFAAWSAKWREDVIEIAQGAGGRNGSDPIFVQGFMEGED